MAGKKISHAGTGQSAPSPDLSQHLNIRCSAKSREALAELQTEQDLKEADAARIAIETGLAVYRAYGFAGMVLMRERLHKKKSD